MANKKPEIVENAAIVPVVRDETTPEVESEAVARLKEKRADYNKKIKAASTG